MLLMGTNLAFRQHRTEATPDFVTVEADYVRFWASKRSRNAPI